MKLWRITTLLMVSVLILTGCNLPIAPSGTPTGSAGVLTQVAVTVDAMRTEQTQQTLQVTVTPSAPVAATPTPADTLAAATPTSPPPTSTVQACDQALFVQDVTVPDGSRFGPGQVFTKTWRLKNIGTCTWSSAYTLVFTSGDALGASPSVNLSGSLEPNQSVDLSVEMKAPATVGKYTSWWKLRNAGGVDFEAPFYTLIEVVASTLTPTASLTPGSTPTSSPPGVVYDFAANACQAEWLSAAGVLPCPGQTGDIGGFVMQLSKPVLETGATETNPALLTYPEGKENGIIAGAFPPLVIQAGYHFRATLGCLNNNPACKVKFQLNYREGSATPQNLGQWDQGYDNSIQSIDMDLSQLAGKTVQIILVVLADGPATEDQAVWVYPRIFK